MSFLDLTSILTWYITFFCLGLISIPFTFLMFKNATIGGYGFSKTIGVLITSYICFLLTIFKLLMFDQYSVMFSVFLWGIINSAIYYKNFASVNDYFKKSVKAILLLELLFLAGFLLWTTIRSYQPSLEGLEKFMDFGFINSILRSEYLPPKDMWFSGHSINYYWYGHYITAFLILLSNINSGIGYNLMIATIFGLTLTGVFNIVSTLLNSSKTVKHLKRRILIGGIISAFAVVLAGNFHTPFILFQNNFEKYWYPDATRFIGYNPDTNDKTIHEFPLYSFVVSDLHAHLLNLPFVILYIAMLTRFAMDKKISLVKNSIPLGFLLGVMFMTNSWDFGNYAIVTACTIGLTTLFNKSISFKTVFSLALFGVTILITAFLTSMPFLMNFESIAEGIDIVKAQTPLWQLLVLWGYPLFITLIFVSVLVFKKDEINSIDVFVVALITAGWILILLPEIIYVKDIYGASHHRANTMFKLTYQAFVLFYLSSGYVFVRIISLQKRILTRLLSSLVITSAIVLTFIYPYYAIKTYYQDFKNQSSLSGTDWLKNEDIESYHLIEWINQNIKEKNAVLLEASGDSYTTYNVVSAYTGVPTVLGWFVHQWLWRGSPAIPQTRADDIREIYTTSDNQRTKELLSKYSVTHIIVSNKERERYSEINTDKFVLFSEVVYQNGNTILYKINQ